MKLWSGRLDEASHPALEAINRSIDFDIRLWPQDIRGSRAHAEMLGEVGLLTPEDVSRILDALERVEAELRDGSLRPGPDDEDIHTLVERRVTELAGDAGRKLHTGRSRNDQVATDLRLFALEVTAAIQDDIFALIDALLTLGEGHRTAILPAYTHLQRGQPVLLAHHLLAYVEMLRRDLERLEDGCRRTAVSPLGAGACAGSSLPLDRERTAELLGLPAIARNSLDAVSDRDFVLELLSALAIVAVHLSRLGEELVLWCSSEFAFVRPADAVSTGSSMMPQKKNPDGAELMRGKAGRVFGHLMTLLSVLKGLPLAYNKDMQEDKEPLFDAVDTVRLVLGMATAMIATLEVNEAAMARAVTPEVLATDLAERLVRRGIPLRRAHEAVARLVRQAESAGKTLVDLDETDLAEVGLPSDLGLDEGLLSTLSVEDAIASKALTGGTAPARVDEAIAEAREWLSATRAARADTRQGE